MRQKKFIEEVQLHCGCVPWALSTAFQLKVIYNVLLIWFKSNFQAPTYCAPNASACVRLLSRKSYGCRVSCTGLYADVLHYNTDTENREDSQKLKWIQAVYRNYKMEYANNIMFDPSLNNISK